MKKVSAGRLALVGTAVLMVPFLAGCPEGDGPSREDSGSCNITSRAVNSAGQPYVGLDCNLDGTEDQSALLNTPEEYPKCIVGTYWPACQGA